MTAQRHSGKPDDQAMVEAAEWFAWLESGECSPADRERWEQWLSADWRHQEAWQLVERINADFALAARGPAREALDAAGQSRRTVLKSLLGIGVALPAAWWLGGSGLVRTWDSDLQTATGEIRAVDLADGTRLWLDTDTAVRLDFNASQRIIELQAGAVHVQTARDARPLQVVADDTRVRPVGTRFSVSRHEKPMTVAVDEGEVDVSSSADHLVSLKAGEKARIDGAGVRVTAATHGDFDWTRGRLVADNMALGQVTEQLNRYYQGMIVTTPAAAELRVVGAYPLDRIDQALDALSDSLPVTVRRLTPWFVVISA